MNLPHPHTPYKKYGAVNTLCRQLVENGRAIYLSVEALEGAEVNECFANVDLAISRKGGRVEYGWQIWEGFPGIMLEAEFHAVWVDPSGVYHDVTPKSIPGVKKILFLPDPARVYEGKQVMNVFAPLKNDQLLVDYIDNRQRFFEATNRGELANKDSYSETSEIQTLKKRGLVASVGRISEILSIVKIGKYMNANTEAEIKANLDPLNVQQTLVKASCFLSAYELIKADIVEQVHDFYCNGFADGKLTYDEKTYSRDVLSLDKSKYKASCEWLIKSNALSEQDAQTLERVYEHRKEIAHELPKLLVDPSLEINTDLLLAATECLRKLGIFWATIEIETSDEWDVDKVDFDGIKSGSYILMEYLLSIAGLKPVK